MCRRSDSAIRQHACGGSSPHLLSLGTLDREQRLKTLLGRVAVVTGGANGIGRGIAAVLAAEGAAVVVADVDGAAAEDAARALRDGGGEALGVTVDVVDRTAVERMAAAAQDRYGRIDILAANAGIFPNTALEAMTDQEWDLVLGVNVKGALHAIQACLPAMRQGRYGRVVVTSSITGTVVAGHGLAHYAASKAALLGLMRTAALELVGDGITVNAILPGNVRTPGLDALDPALLDRVVASIPLGRLAEPEEVGWAVRFLASEEAAYITGQTLILDGGQLLPELP
jgi:3-oxoacyl-[acyl-carrier protein] reductase